MLPLSLLSFCYLALTVNAAPYPITTNRTAVFNVASSGGNVSSTHQYGLMFEVCIQLIPRKDSSNAC